jgi:nucleotide-binding universal stress UspA family protein
MYKKILLAYDGTREGRAALREGAMLARTFGAEIVLLAIVNAYPSTDAMGGPVMMPGDHGAILNEGLERARKLGLNVSGQVVQGEPVEAIKSWAARSGADLVVVGHRKRSLLERWWSDPGNAILSDHLNCSLLISLNEISDDAFAAAVVDA